MPIVLKSPRASCWSMVAIVPSPFKSGSFSNSYQSSTGPTGTPFAPKDTYDYQHTAWNIHEFLNDQLSQYTLHPAGTNVDFDLRQLDVHLSRHLNHPIAEGLHHRKLDLTTLRLTDQAIGRDPYQNHAGTHRVQDCIRRDRNDYANYLDIMRAGIQGARS